MRQGCRFFTRERKKLKPYYDRNGITIYHGDCREILPTLPKVDLVLTDPPYGLGDKWNGGAGGNKSSWRIPQTEAKSWDMECTDAMPLVLSRAADAVVWGGNYYDLPPSRCWFIWDKKQPDTWTTAQAEMAWTTFDKTVRVFRMAQCEAHSPLEMDIKRHPAQKPLSLIKWCLKWTTAKTVLDPFMGSGTTLVAAKLAGIQATGIDISERYCEIAAKRLEQEVFAFEESET